MRDAKAILSAAVQAGVVYAFDIAGASKDTFEVRES
jgi:hypothetical protein